jgi:hypothetical protein
MESTHKLPRQLFAGNSLQRADRRGAERVSLDPVDAAAESGIGPRFGEGVEPVEHDGG